MTIISIVEGSTIINSVIDAQDNDLTQAINNIQTASESGDALAGLSVISSSAVVFTPPSEEEPEEEEPEEEVPPTAGAKTTSSDLKILAIVLPIVIIGLIVVVAGIAYLWKKNQTAANDNQDQKLEEADSMEKVDKVQGV